MIFSLKCMGFFTFSKLNIYLDTSYIHVHGGTCMYHVYIPFNMVLLPPLIINAVLYVLVCRLPLCIDQHLLLIVAKIPC